MEETEQPAEITTELEVTSIINTIHKGINHYTFDEVVASLRTIPVRDKYFLSLLSEEISTDQFISWWSTNINYLHLQPEPIKMDMLTILAGVALTGGNVTLAEDAISMAEKYADEVNQLPSLCRLFKACIDGTKLHGKKEEAVMIWRESLKAAALLEAQPDKP
jgi:hypothetical protein